MKASAAALLPLGIWSMLSCDFSSLKRSSISQHFVEDSTPVHFVPRPRGPPNSCSHRFAALHANGGPGTEARGKFIIAHSAAALLPDGSGIGSAVRARSKMRWASSLSS